MSIGRLGRNCVRYLMKRSITLLLLLVLAVTGCMSTACRLDPVVLKEIKQGVTTRTEVEKTLGKPLSEMNGSNHKTVVSYDYTRLRPSSQVPSPGILPSYAGTLLIRSVGILYDKNQTVEKVTFHEATTSFHRQMSSYWVGQVIEEKDLNQVIKGASTVGDVERFFGPAMGKGLTVEGRPYFVWFYRMVRTRFNLKRQQQSLFVYFDNLGIVQDYAVVGNVGVPSQGK